MPTVDLTYMFDTDDLLDDEARWLRSQLDLHRDLIQYHQREYERLYERLSKHTEGLILRNPPFKFVVKSAEEPGK